MLRHFSSPLLLVVITLMGMGVVQVYSASYIFAAESYGSSHYFFLRQASFVAIGIFALLFMAQIPLNFFKKWGWVFWLLSAMGLVATFLPGVGVRVGGAIRWIQLPMGLRFEPSEVLKLSFSFLFASLLVRDQTTLAKIQWPWLVVLLLAPVVLLLRQPDFGSFVIISAVGLGLLFSFGLRWKWIASATAVAIPLFYLLVMQVPYRRARVLAFLDPWSDPEQKGFQVIQSMLSFSNGGFLGAGLGRGQGKLFFLPEAHTDFTLAVMGEEIGFIGFLIVMSLYGFIVVRGFQIAMKTSDKYFKALSLGITLTFALNVFINAGVVMGLLPTKGLTLPFLSYGGSSLLAMSLMLGVLLNIEKNLDESGFVCSSHNRHVTGRI